MNYTYDSSTFLEFLSSIKNRSTPLVRDSSIFLFPNEVLKVLNYQQVRNKYSYLASNENMIGDMKDLDIKDREKKACKIVDG